MLHVLPRCLRRTSINTLLCVQHSPFSPPAGRAWSTRCPSHSSIHLAAGNGHCVERLYSPPSFTTHVRCPRLHSGFNLLKQSSCSQVWCAELSLFALPVCSVTKSCLSECRRQSGKPKMRQDIALVSCLTSASATVLGKKLPMRADR